MNQNLTKLTETVPQERVDRPPRIGGLFAVLIDIFSTRRNGGVWYEDFNRDLEEYRIKFLIQDIW